jgi:hypothetical protein
VAQSAAVEVAAKLQLKPGQSVAVVGDVRDGALELGSEHPSADDPATADAVIAFVANSDELDGLSDAVVASARRDALTWVAYPKAGRLGTDLNRDSLAERMRNAGVRPVRQVALDDVWSALRFRPA